jgi:hypothetical protein
MLLGILVNVRDHIPKLSIRGDWHTSKGVLEQAAGSPVRFVDRLGIGVEEVGELITDVMRP